VNVFQAAIRLVDPTLRLVFRNVRIRISAEVFGKDDLIGPGAPHRECVAYDPPLWLSVQAKALSEVMDESNQHHPAGVTVPADGLRGLQEVLDLGEVSVRIAVIDQSVQVFRRLPNALPAARQSEVLLLFAQHILEGLLLVI